MNIPYKLLHRLKYALESISADEQEEVVSMIEAYAAGQVNIEDIYLLEIKNADRLN